MASVPYSPIPDDAPNTSVGDDYQHVEASPAAFGGLLAQGAQQAGAGASKAAAFYGQAGVDDQINKVMTRSQAIRTGDPNQFVTNPDGTPVLGADGKPQPDTGYLGTAGADAMQGWKPALSQLDSAIADGRKNLQTPEQQLEFDSQTRRLRSIWADEIGRHADIQAKTWMGTVNSEGAAHALNGIASNPDDATSLAHNTSDLINFRMKAAEVSYGDNLTPDLRMQIVASSKQEALKAQIQAISVQDPARAQSILEKNKTIAGTEYEPLANALRSRADQANGYAFVDGTPNQPGALAKAHAGAGYANPALPVYAQAASEGGMSAAGLARTAQVESSGNPNAGAGTSHQGLVQAGGPYWARYGSGSPLDPEASIRALGRSTAADRTFLRHALGVDPSDAQLYVAHQQGPGGAQKLFLFPNARAGDLVGDKAISGNGGNPNMTAKQFTDMWIAKFNGVSPYAFGSGQSMTLPASVSGTAPPPAAAPVQPDLPTFAATPDAGALASATPPAPAAPGAPAEPAQPLTTRTVDNIPPPTDVKANIFSQINAAEQSGQLTHMAAQHARVYASQQLQSQSIAQEQDTRARKALSEQSVDNYNRRMMAGDFNGLQQAIINDPHLTGEARWSLYEHLQHVASADQGSKDTKEYGSAYFDLLKRVTAPSSDPNRIDDPSTLVSHLTPHGDLTTAGYKSIMDMVKESRKGVETAAVNSTKVELAKYAHSRISLNEDDTMGGLLPPKKDIEGERRFESGFMPAFNSAYDRWIAQNKDPYQFLNRDNVDKLIAPFMRTPAQMRAAGLVDAPVDQNPATSLASPSPDIDQKAYASVITAAPTSGGKPLMPSRWVNDVNRLALNPTPKMIQFWDQSPYGQAGYKAENILRALGVRVQQ